MEGKMIRVSLVVLTFITTILAEPPVSNSYGPPSSNYNNNFRNFNSNFNSNQGSPGNFQNLRNTLTSFGGQRGSDPAQLGANIPGPKVFRHISLFVAPQDDEQQQRVRTIRPQQSADKHVNIIFIKAPSRSNSQQTEVLLPEVPQQKTLVYVLVKKQEANENNVKVRGPAPTKPPAPEVYFIKYKDNANSGSNSNGGYSNNVGGGFDSGNIELPIRSNVASSFSTSYGVPS